MPGGRPTIYTEELASKICDGIASGVSLVQICRQDGMPHEMTVLRWVHDTVTDVPSEFRMRFLRAREIGTHHMAHECLEIADDSSGDIKYVGREGEEREALDSEFVARSKLRIDTRMKLMGMWNKRDYGDKKAVELSGPNGASIPVDGTMTVKDAAQAYQDSLGDEEGRS